MYEQVIRLMKTIDLVAQAEENHLEAQRRARKALELHFIQIRKRVLRLSKKHPKLLPSTDEDYEKWRYIEQ